MSNRLEQVLSYWAKFKDEFDWVLATVVETQGSSYRKPGAMMVINDMGQFQGMLSGGCLEPDLLLKARKCLTDNRNTLVTYDSSNDDETAWQLGLGCGGIITILLQPITRDNEYLQLDTLLAYLQQNKVCFYAQNLQSNQPQNSVSTATQLSARADPDIVEHRFSPAPVVAIIGGGIDARPVAQFASSLGWNCHVVEDRVNFAQPKWFPNVSSLYRKPIGEMITADWFANVDAIIIMTHSVDKDAKALSIAQQSQAKYVGLLGPKHRTDKVLTAANLTFTGLTLPLSNPIGLDIGGDIPEAIALSIVSEVQAVLEGKLVLNSNATERLHVSSL